MNLEFSTARDNAAADEEAGAEPFVPRTDTIAIDGKKYLVYEPSSSLVSLMAAALYDNSGLDLAGVLWKFFKVTLQPEAFIILRDAAASSKGIELSDLAHLMMEIVEDFGGFPTQPPVASSTSPTPTGQPSTGRQPGPGSTRSSFGQPDSSI